MHVYEYPMSASKKYGRQRTQKYAFSKKKDTNWIKHTKQVVKQREYFTF